MLDEMEEASEAGDSETVLSTGNELLKSLTTDVPDR